MEEAAPAGDGLMAPSATSASDDVGGRRASALPCPIDAMEHAKPSAKDDIDINIASSRGVDILETNQTQNRGEARRHKSFQERLDELKAYKAKHGHLKVKEGEDKRLHGFCCNIRSARRGTGAMKLTKDRIASLDALGFDWGKNKSFEERLEELKAHKAGHGHLNVKRNEDSSLYNFCKDTRCARRGHGKMKLTKERIASLNALGFDWGTKRRKSQKTFQERVEDLAAYKAERGHLKVKESEHKSLATFCQNTRYARRNPGSGGGGRRELTAEEIASLDALGFDWGVGRAQSTKTKTFQERVEDLAAHKADRGHLNVKESEDKSLASWCAGIRKARRGHGTMKVDDERIASLDSLGFEWEPQADSFRERLEELKAYKAEHGHLEVKKSEDKSLYRFCGHIRHTRRGTGKMKLTEERIAALDALGFDWGTKRRKSQKSFQERLEELKTHKADRGHLNVKESEDKSLADFCTGARWARKNPGRRGAMKLTEERIAALDELGFDWVPISSRSSDAFMERLQELKAYKDKHGHTKVKESEDKSLATFCYNIRSARRGHGSMKLTDARLASLVALGFDWEPRHKYNGVFDKKIFDMARRIKLAWEEPQQNNKGERQEKVPAREKPER